MEISINNIQRFIFEPLASNMYMIIEREEALLIDPNKSEKASCILEKGKTSFVTILLTHEHYDHTSGVNWYRDRYESRLICQKSCAEKIALAKNNRPMLVAKVIADKNETRGRSEAKEFLSGYRPYSCLADEVFDIELDYAWKGHVIKFTSTPGHTPGSCCILIDDRFLFTGDSLVNGSPIITRFPGGSRNDYDSITKPYLCGVSADVWVLPGHGEAFPKRLIADVDL